MTLTKTDLRYHAMQWVKRTFSFVPVEVARKLSQIDDDEIEEVTPFGVGDRVYVYDTDAHTGVLMNRSENTWLVLMDNGEEISVEESDMEFEDSYPPFSVSKMGGYLWAFNDDYDMERAEKDNYRILKEAGFRIFRQQDYGILIGTDSGSDWYEDHWIPLYKAWFYL